MSELKTNLEQILQEKTTKLIPENIKRKVEIFDVTGTDGDAEVEELQAKIIETRQEIADTRRDLENSAATVTGAGENITLNQTAEATFKKLGVSGNSKQAQYTGKNLAKVSGSTSVNLFGSISVSKDSNDIIINGTATGDTAAQKAFVLDGDTHGNYAAYITPSNTMSLTAGTYVLTVNNITGSYSGVGAFWIRFVKKNESQPHTAIASLTLPSTSVSFNIEVDGEYFISPNFSYTSETNVTFNNYKFNIMLASGTDTTYEPYVGGTASPNLDYPQEIENCGDNVNEWDKELEVAAWTDEGVKNPNNHLFVVNSTPKDVKPNTAYTVSQKENPSQYRISFFNNNTFISNIYNAQDTTEGYKSYTFTTPSNCNKVYVHFRSTLEVIAKGTYDMTAEDITNIKLELGTIATSYSPYGCGNVNMKVSNKNLFNKDTILLNKELVGNYGNVISTSGWYVSDFIRVKPNTNYRLTKGANGSSNCFYDINKKFIKTVIGARDVASPNDDRVAYVRFNGVLTDLDISNIQFEEGSTVTDYVAHQEQKFTFPLAQNQKLMLGDYLADDGIHHVRGQYIFTGSENFIKSNGYKGNYWIELKFLSVKFKTLASFICTHAISVSSLGDFKVGTCLNDGTLNLWLGNETQFPTVESFKAYLAEQYTNDKPVAIECELAEEVIVPYTSAQQEVYDTMKRAISYEEQTNVSSLDTVSPIFTVIAFKDADLVITSLDNQLTLKE